LEVIRVPDRVATYSVVARVVSRTGRCNAGHKVGDEFVCGHETPKGICIWAYQAIFPFVAMFRYGASLPWKEGPDRVTLVCPDPVNKVCFEVRRGEEVV